MSASNRGKKRKAKWEFSVLFDADTDEATRILDEYGGLVMEATGSASAGLRRINDLKAWQECKCGQGRRGL